MYTDFTIKNFRVFDEEGTTIPLRTVTILTGCNNAGKSSIVKALCLLKDFCQQIETDYEDGKKLRLESYKMDFHKTPNCLMGGFNLVLHHPRKQKPTKKNDVEANGSTKEYDNKHIIIEVIVESSWLLQDVIVHLEFGSLNWDDLNNGYLQAYSIQTLDRKVIYKAKRDGNASMDFSIVKKSFLHFLYGQYAFSKWQNEINYRSATNSYPTGEDMEGILLDNSIKSIIDDLGPTALIYLLEWQVSHCHYMWKEGTNGPCNQLLNKIPEYSFAINSPKLGVFCYFPCLEVFMDIEKKDIRQEVNRRLNSLSEPMTLLNRKIVDLFLDSFEASDADSLHEFIRKKENSRYFVDSNFPRFLEKGFAFPSSFWRMDTNSDLFDDSSLPETANWSVILSAMDLINKATTNTSHSLINFDELNMSWYYPMENNIDSFLRNVVEEVFVNLLPGSMAYFPTTIVQPKRLYSLEENNDFARTLKKYFDARRAFKEEKDTGVYYADSKGNDYTPCMFIDKWLKQLEIADHVEIKSHADGYGVTIHLYDSEEDKVGMQLVDKGVGVLQLFAVLLKIEIAILEMRTNEKLYKYYTTGLSKEIIKYLRTYNQLHPATVALEEPECHLHPSLQSKLADMLVDANKQYGIHFLVESHSEYLIRKLQLLVSQKEIDSKDISLLYVNSASRPSFLPTITDIGLNPDGTLKNEFGKGFFDESLKLSKELYKPKTEDDEE